MCITISYSYDKIRNYRVYTVHYRKIKEIKCPLLFTTEITVKYPSDRSQYVPVSPASSKVDYPSITITYILTANYFSKHQCKNYFLYGKLQPLQEITGARPLP